MKPRCQAPRLLFALLLTFAVAAPMEARTDLSSRSTLVETYGRVPMSFEVNRGQAPADVRFVSRGIGYTVYLTGSSALLTLQTPEKAQTATVGMEIAGANRDPKVAALDELATRSNYLLGVDPRGWRTDVPNYARVKYHEVYPGIDLEYYGNHQQLEYDFALAPGADPDLITLRFTGVDSMRVDERGNLVLSAAGKELQFIEPFVYQLRHGKREQIAGAYRLLGASDVGFEIGPYDPLRSLVIDPVALVYSSFLGDEAFDTGHGIAVDKSGSAYVVGQTNSAAYPLKGPYDSTLSGCCDIVVTKLDSKGTSILYSTFLGGSSSDNGYSIGVDSNGRAFLTGYTSSTDFPVTPSAFDQTYNGSATDVVVVELNASGSALLYSTFLGGTTGNQVGLGIAGAGDIVFVTGYTAASDFPLKNQAQNDKAGEDAFVAAFNVTGAGVKSLLWSTYLGGNGTDDGNAIATRNGTRVWVTGNTSSTDFKTKKDFQQNQPGTDAFLTLFNGNGQILKSSYLGGNGLDTGFGVALDSAGNAYVTGVTDSTNFPFTAGAFDATCCTGGFANAFVTKVDSFFVPSRSTYLGGSDGYQHGRGITVHPTGNVVVAGYTVATDFPVTPDAYDSDCGSDGACDPGACLGLACTDVFLSVLSADLKNLVYSTYFGGSGGDENTGGNVVAVGPGGGICLTGTTDAGDFPHAPATVFDALCGNDGSCNSEKDGFVSKFSFSP